MVGFHWKPSPFHWAQTYRMCLKARHKPRENPSIRYGLVIQTSNPCVLELLSYYKSGETYQMVMMVFLDGAQYERMMMVLEVGGSESPKEGMLNRSPGTSEGGGHLLIVVIYISSYQSSFNSSIHYFKTLCCQNPKQSSTRSKRSIVTAYCMIQ